MMISKRLFACLLGLFFSSDAVAQPLQPPFYSDKAFAWADSVMSTMSTDEIIGQLFMVDAYSNRDTAHENLLSGLITDYHIGGVIFFQGGPVREVLLQNKLQALAKVPLLVGMDAEWGLSMRLDSTVRFPRQMTLSTARNDTLVYEIAKEIGRQCRRMGIHINFAPVADVNNNPSNPVINTRSFGDNPYEVADMSEKYIKGLQEQGVMACLKHFPGHGNTDADSHLALPVINSDRAELDTMELVPFKKLLNKGTASVMVAHLMVPALDTGKITTSLSNTVVTKLLQEEMGFSGLVFTDALNMKGVAEYFEPGEIAIRALNAGNDVLLFSADVPAAFTAVKNAYENDSLDGAALRHKVRKILIAKYWAGLQYYEPVDTTNLISDLNNYHAQQLASKAFSNAVTILKDSLRLPLRNLSEGKIVSVVIADTIGNPFQLQLSKYGPVDRLAIPRNSSKAICDSIFGLLSGYENVVLSIHNIFTNAALRYGITDTIVDFVSRVTVSKKTAVVIFGNSYSLLRLNNLRQAGAVVMAFEDTYVPQWTAAEVIMGGKQTKGRLPVMVNADFKKGIGESSKKAPLRLTEKYPGSAAISSAAYTAIDSMVNKMVSTGATPGGQILAVYNGEIVLNKPFGQFTYDSSRAVTDDDLYDIASVTKIAATGLALMKLSEQKKIDVRKKLSYYLPELKKTNKKNLIISDILTHQAGLKAWLPIWKNSLENGKPAYNIYHHVPDVNYNLKVADSLYMLPAYREKVWDAILDSEVDKPGKYVYSDIGMLLMQRLVEHITGKTLDTYVKQEFYEPMGLYNLTFNPLEQFPISRIAPTENDTVFRMQVVRGTVHDPTAAMLGGVAGNAGLFSNAWSLGALMQMLMDDGVYGGKRYLEAKTISQFTSRYNQKGDNRRGLVFDRPQPEPAVDGPTAVSASQTAFGHSGFTGTCAWADPQKGIVYIFLSNRVYPSAANKQLSTGNYRTNIMEAVYKGLR